MKDIRNKYGNIGYILEYCDITEKEAMTLCNMIIDESIAESNNEILETMYHAILTGVISHKIGDKLAVDTIVKMIDKFNEEVSDYLIIILAYTGKNILKR